jgi:NOL1/NOP2/fmu family ribosome biogenesis protein
LKQNEVLPVAKMVQIGLHIGTLNKDIFSPHQGLILSSNASKKIPRFKVNDQEALEILRGTDWRIENQTLNGWHIVQWNNWDLAWVKMVKGRVSNHYPKEWRIRFL